MSSQNGNDGNVNSQDDLNKFTKLCAELECALANAYSSLDEILSLKDVLLEQSLPCSVKVKLTLAVGRLHRSMSDLGVPSGEITRLVRLYAVPWENKSKALKKLHQDYESKQHQLDIALRRLEMVGVHTMRMEKEKRIMNWERLFARMVGSKGHGQRWKFLIQQFKNKIKKGENIASLYSQASDDDDDYDNENDDENLQRVNHVPFGRTFSDRLKRFDRLSQVESSQPENKFEDTGPRHSLIEEESETSTALPLSDIISVGSMEQDTSSLVSSQNPKKVRFDDQDDFDRSNENDKMSSGLGLHTETAITKPKKRVITVEKECWTHEPDTERLFHIRVFKPVCKTLSTPWCSISFDKQLRKTLVFKDPQPEDAVSEKKLMANQKGFMSEQDKKPGSGGKERKTTPMEENFQEFTFKLSSDFETRNFDEIFLKISVHPENKKNMIAMASLKLTDLKIINVDEANETKPATYQLKSMVNNSELTFNKPCGNLYLQCFYSTVYLPKVVNRGTETLSIEELTERIIAMRRNETLKRLKSASTTMIEKPVYTEEQMKTAKEQLKQELLNLKEEYEERLGLMISQLNKENAEEMREFVNAATSPLFMWSSSRNWKDGADGEEIPKASAESVKPSKSQKKKSPKKVSRQKTDQIWGENLPADFFERMEMFQEASSKHHQQLKEKINDTTEKEFVRKLATQNRLDTSSTPQSFADKDVCLPALFMPSKTKNLYSSKARSYFHAFGTREGRLTQPPSILQLPRLKQVQDNSDIVGIYESVHGVDSQVLDTNEFIDENQLDRLSDDSSITIDVCGVDPGNEFNDDSITQNS